MTDFSFDVYFINRGRIKGLDNYSVIMFPDDRIEAIRFSDNSFFNCKVRNESGVYESNSKDIIGKGVPVNDIIFSYKKRDEDRLFYRFFLNDCWTEIYEADDNKHELNGDINGIQIIIDKELNEEIIFRANDRIRKYAQIEKRLFLNNKDAALVHLNKDYIDERPNNLIEIENGIILPLKEITDSEKKHVIYYSGGVTDEKYNFVSGLERRKDQRMNFCCMESYIPDSLIKSNDTVIFGGILIAHFGHILTEALSRLWWVMNNPSADYRIVFLWQTGKEEERKEPSIKILKDFMKILKIDENRLIILDKPTQFAKVYIPDQLIRLHSDVRKSYLELYQKMADNCPNCEGFEKIYLTRTHLKDNDIINEDFFEKFFERRGYRIVAPEELSLTEQIGIMKSTKEVICSIGTLSHLTLFCKSETVITFLRRDEKNMLMPQTLVDCVSEHMPFYVDVTYNLLPVKHNVGLFLFGPTPNFVDYLNSRKIEYTQEEIEINIQDFISEYIDKWVKIFRDPICFSNISNCDIFDVLLSLNNALGYEEISSKDYDTAARKNKKKVKKLEDKIEKMRTKKTAKKS